MFFFAGFHPLKHGRTEEQVEKKCPLNWKPYESRNKALDLETLDILQSPIKIETHIPT
jgi:hypothetical protein